MMTSNTLREIGPSLLGVGWASRLAEQLKVRRQTVWRWASIEDGKVPADAESTIKIVFLARIAEEREELARFEALLS
jgi:hypothetical protein